MDTKSTFKVGQLYSVKLLSKDGGVVKEGIYTYKGFDYTTSGSFQHIFADTDIRLGVKYNIILIPNTLLDRYDISEIFI